ncbi:hypothetical protein QTP70_027191, partial [Hemibagrus guttatus]
MDRTEENRQEYKELQRRVKREVSKAKQKAYEELYTRLDTREGEKDLYRLARQRDRDGKDVQQVRVIKDRDGRVLTSEESVQRRWKEHFEELMNEENEREKRVEGVNSVEQKVDKIRKDEVRKALKRMKSGKAVGPDDIPVEVWKCLGEAAVEFLANLFNRVLESERMPEEWRRSVLVPIFKNKGDVQSCSNYRGIKLMSHTMKVWERVVEARLRKVVEICEQQYGFMPRKSTTDAIFALRILMEKYRDGQKELHCVFVDLEKAYDRVPREELWYCMRKSGVAEKYVRVVQDMYERSRTVVRCAVGQTEEFNVEVGLHQGSALSPFLFAIVMDQLSEEVRQESPWTMMFADDIVICSESREQVEENLERWRFVLERRGMKVSRSKTEYMCVNEREGSGTVRLQGEEVKKVQEFKYLGSTVQSNGECGKEVKKRVQAGWNGWRKVSGVLCDRKISARIKGKVYRTVVRPAMLYGLETVSLRKRQESELEVAELKMLRFSLGVTRLDRIRNEYIRGTAHVGRLGDKDREARLRWFGHVQRRDSMDPNSRNSSGTDGLGRNPAGMILLSLTLSVLALLTTAINSLVITAIIVTRKLHHPANYLICSLAVTDLLVAILVMPFSIVYIVKETWVMGEVMCTIWLSVDITCCTCSILHLAAIAVDRYRAITDAVEYSRKRTSLRAAVTISVVWFLSILISLPPMLWGHHRTEEVAQEKECLIKHENIAFTLYSTFGAFYIPLILILILYYKIYQAAKILYHKRRPSPMNKLEINGNKIPMCSDREQQSHDVLNLPEKSMSEPSTEGRISAASPNFRRHSE